MSAVSNAISLDALLRDHHITAHAVIAREQDAKVAAKRLRLDAAPGGRVLLVRRPERTAWVRLTALLGARESHMTESEDLASSLLGAGFEAPTLLADTPDLVAVAAQLPLHSDPLDDVFA